jgi:predicted DNA-binding transcriptional regulator YafY
MVAYDLPLRRDVLIRLTLPVDFTDEEAERLCGIIRAIAMPSVTLDQAREVALAALAKREAATAAEAEAANAAEARRTDLDMPDPADDPPPERPVR